MTKHTRPMSGLYVHIPFCKSRCIYCGFFSTTDLSLQDRYVDALCCEMGERRAVGATIVSTIYIGGGTPSQLSQENMRRLFKRIYSVYMVVNDAEITLECNPDDISTDYAEMLRQIGVNRISMGAQTFANDRLRFLRRRHTSRQVETAVKVLRNIGFRNISIDLMFGFPNETLDDWDEDISRALALDVEHISAYSLMFEEQTRLKQMLDNGEISEIDEETSLAMYDRLITRLTDAGYEHYEISNFARPGYRSRHNSSYWQGTPYIGIGAAAHSYDVGAYPCGRPRNHRATTRVAPTTLAHILSAGDHKGRPYSRPQRRWNVDNIMEYISAIETGRACYEYEILDDTTRFNEAVMTGLRTIDGIRLSSIEQQFGIEYKETLLDNAERHIKGGFLILENGVLRLTRKGLFISNTVMSDLMIVS